MHKPTNSSDGDKVNFLKVDVQPGWKIGDVICVDVPTPTSTPLYPMIVPEVRKLYVKVPVNVGDHFYARYKEDEESGMPMLTTDPSKTEEAYPLMGAPIVVPSSAAPLKKPRGFLHFGLLWEAVFPVACYIGVLLAGFFVGKRLGLADTFSVKMQGWIYRAWQLPMLILACILVYLRYRKSVLKREVVIQVIISGIGMCAALIPHWFMNKFILALPTLLSSWPFDYNMLVVKMISEKVAPTFFTVIYAPIMEEIQKYLVVRFIAFRSVICDGQAIMAYAIVSGLIFALEENSTYLVQILGLPDKVLNTMPVAEHATIACWRAAGFFAHPAFACMAASRLVQRRFLGKRWGMFDCVWPSILLHVLWNGLDIFLKFLLLWYKIQVSEETVDLIRGGMLVFFCIVLRQMIVKIENIPVVNVRKLVDDKQISPRGWSALLTDTFCWFSSKHGIAHKTGRQHRPNVFTDEAQEIQSSVAQNVSLASRTFGQPQTIVETEEEHKVEEEEEEVKGEWTVHDGLGMDFQGQEGEAARSLYPH